MKGWFTVSAVEDFDGSLADAYPGGLSEVANLVRNIEYPQLFYYAYRAYTSQGNEKRICAS